MISGEPVATAVILIRVFTGTLMIIKDNTKIEKCTNGNRAYAVLSTAMLAYNTPSSRTRRFNLGSSPKLSAISSEISSVAMTKATNEYSEELFTYCG